MPDRSRVPPQIIRFDPYIRNAVEHLLAFDPQTGNPNWQRLLLAQGEMDRAEDFLATWTSGNSTVPGIYDLHSDPRIKNKGTRRQVTEFMREFSLFFSPLLVRMSGSPHITSADRLVLRIAGPNPKPVLRREPIRENIVIGIQQVGGGQLRFNCFTSHESKRGKLAAGADSVFIAYRIGEAPSGDPDKEKMLTQLSTRAAFTLHAGSENSGEKLHAFARWYNVKHRELAGPWSGRITVLVL